jgi:hypothetical protein
MPVAVEAAADASSAEPRSAVDVLIPTCGRPVALALTLAMLAAQTWQPLRIVVSDQGEPPAVDGAPELQAVLRL